METPVWNLQICKSDLLKEIVRWDLGSPEDLLVRDWELISTATKQI